MRRDAGVLREGLQCCTDVGKSQGRVFNRVKLVDGEHDGRHAQQLHEQRVTARLRQQLGQGRLPVKLGGIDQHHGGVGAGGGGDHVARVLLVAGRVGNDEFARGGVEVAVGHVNGDALLALGLQAVGQQGQVGLAAALYAGQLVLQHGFAVYQQPPDQRAFTVVHAAASDKAQGCAGVLGGVGRRCRRWR